MSATTTLEEMLPGARTAIHQCLAVTAQDRVFIMSDRATRIIGEALRQAALERTQDVTLHDLEEFGQRPFYHMPEGLAEALRTFRPTVTVFAAQGQPGEVTFRLEMGQLLRREFTVRHAHMIGITPLLMKTGMRANYEQVARRTMQIYERVRQAREIRVTDPYGTHFVVRLNPDRLRWIPSTGLIHEPGEWSNLPDGEVFTAPADAEGALVVHLLGDYFSEKYGLLPHPMTIHVAQGRVTKIEHPDPALMNEVWTYLTSHENSARVGEFALGTNEFLTELTGNLLQDEKFPGVHVAFGNPYPDRTGADWTAPTHIDVIPLKVNVWVDGEPVMREGRFVV